MIKLFRKIRQRLLVENKFNKYLIYAVGEIVLVVIGILIALWLNNLNEKRKRSNTISNIYSIIQIDLQKDIETINNVLIVTQTKDSIFKKVINQELTYEDYKSCATCMTILYGYPDITLNNRGLNLLKENSTNIGSNIDSITIEIYNFYNFFNTEIKAAIDEVERDYSDNHFFFKNNKAWFYDFLNKKINEEFIQYALTSSDYKNRINSFNLLYYDIYLSHLKNYKQKAIELINKIDKQSK